VSSVQLYGRYDGSRWQTGLLTTILKKAYSQADLASRWKPARAVSGTSDRSTSKWIILDGQLNADWVDTLTGLLDDGGQTLLPNGETLCLHGKCLIYRSYRMPIMWWCSDGFGALHPKGCRFESTSSHCVPTLDQLLTHYCL